MLAAGCAPGHLSWSTGDDLVRSALFIQGGTSVSIESNYQILLSTGEFTCDLPSFADDPEQETLDELYAAAIREDARHVGLTLVRHPSARGAGRYDGQPRIDDPQELLETLGENPRLAWGSYLGIEEATFDLEGLCAEYEVTAYTFDGDLGARGEVVLSGVDEDALVGTFSFPEEHLSGRFRAEPCEEARALFDLLVLASPGTIETIEGALGSSCDE